MNSKLTCLLLLLAVVQSFCQVGWEPWDENVAPIQDELPCDHPVCVEPCPEAAPPLYCPRNITKCSSGCVCMLECQRPEYVCFQTKFCQSRRRYLSKRPTPAIV